MNFTALAKFAALAFALTLNAAASPARAEQCDDILAAITKHGEALMKKDVKAPMAICAGMGELVGLMHSARIVATECSRDAVAKDMEESAKAIEEGIAKDCK